MLKLTPINQFIAVMISHIATIYWLYEYSSWANFGLVFFMYFLTGCLGMTMTYHRLLTHRSWKAPKWFEYLGTFLGTIGLTGSSMSWTAAHRKHHSSADKQGDPHSPVILGYIKAQWWSMFSPINIARSPVLRDRFHVFFHRYYFHINLVYGLILFMLGGIYALLTFWLVPACVLWNAGSIINTVCHTKWLGYRRYNVPDYSTNNIVMGVLMWGEGWHNNHHRFQGRPNIGEAWYEIDIGWYLIKLLRKE